MATGTVTVGSSTYYGIATYTDINNIASNSYSNSLASAGSSVAKKCVTYENLADTPLALLYNVAGTYDAKKCVKAANITKKVTVTFSPSSVSFSSGGGMTGVTVTVQGSTISSVTVNSKPTWVNVSVTATTVLLVSTTGSNTSTSTRSGYINVTANTTSGNSTGSLPVSQSAASTSKTVSSITLPFATASGRPGVLTTFSGTVHFSDGTTAALLASSTVSVSTSNSSVVNAWTHGIDDSATAGCFNYQGIGSATITVTCGGKNAKITVSSSATTTNSVFKCIGLSKSATCLSYAQVQLAQSSTGSNARTYTINEGEPINPQAGICINNFAPTGYSYFTSQSTYENCYIRVYIPSIYVDGSTHTFAIQNISGTKYGSKSVLSGAAYDSGWIKLTNLHSWTQYNSGTNASSWDIGSGKLIPCKLYIS